MAAPREEEVIHPPMDELLGLEYCIDSNPSWGEAIALGFQHYILALGTAVMIPTFLVPFFFFDTVSGLARYKINRTTWNSPHIIDAWFFLVPLMGGSGAYKIRAKLTQFNCRTDRANLISTAPWIKIPYPLQWGAPSFDVGHAFGMMSAVLVSLLESTGAYRAAPCLASATPPPAHVLSRGIGWQGIGILLDGMLER